MAAQAKVLRPPTPPRGWNNFDWGNGSTTYATPNTTEIKEQAQGMKQYLLPHGYEYFVVGGGWYNGSDLTSLDGYGRPIPDQVTYPDLNGNWSSISAYLNGLGLKMGIWETHGIPLAAYDAKLPVLGTSFTAQDVVVHDENGKPTPACSWIDDQYQINTSHPGAAAYYKSIIDQLSGWGIEYIVMDCVFGANYAPQDIMLYSEAIEQSPRDFVYLLSPGDPSHTDRMAVAQKYATMARITVDYYANWHQTFTHFAPLTLYSNEGITGTENGFYIFQDKMPFGKMRGRAEIPWSWWPQTEILIVVLWTISQSPLLYSGDMRMNSTCPVNGTEPCGIEQHTIDLLTNDRVLAVNNDIRHVRQLSDDGFSIVYTGNSASLLPANSKYVAIFNILCGLPRVADPPCLNETITSTISFASIGLPNRTYNVFDVWNGTSLGSFNYSFTVDTIPLSATLLSITL
eukprot:gene1254-1942_t